MAHEIEVPTGPRAPLSDLGSGMKVARFVALLTAVGGVVAALLLFTYDGTDPGVERVYVGIGVGLLAITLALTTLLLFLAGWAESSTTP